MQQKRKNYQNELNATFAKIVVLTIFCLASLTAKAQTHFAGGNGTDGNPYIIETAAQLAKLAELVNEGDADYNEAYYQLSKDIDLSDYGAGFNNGEGWIPIGNYNNPFQGKFDGNGKKITKLYINNNSSEMGLFGDINNGTEVKNLSLIDVDVKGGGSFFGISYRMTGGITGSLYQGSITDCYVTGTVTGYQYVGGIAGTASDSHISNCHVEITIIGTDNGIGCTGGITGSMYFGNIINCYSVGNVNGGRAVGGIAGESSDNIISNCYSTATVSNNSGDFGGIVGGIVGIFGRNAVVENCIALNPSIKGYITGVGRVAGQNHEGNGTLSGNFAFSEMINEGDVAFRGEYTHNGHDGESKTAAELQTESGYPVALTQAPWTYEPGKLPGLGAAVDMPTHLQASGETPPCPDPTYSGKFGENNAWSWWICPDGTLTIRGTGEMPQYSFSYSSIITAIIIEDGVTSIYGGAFRDCENLTSVTIPNSVTSIGGSAFEMCTSLASVTIPNSVTSIGFSAFQWCTGLTSVTIQNNIIGDEMFQGCTSLTSVTIPNSVTSIGDGAFSGSTTSIDVAADNANYSSENGVLFNKNKTLLIQYPSMNENVSYDIPETVTTICNGAFYSCSNLISVSIPNSVNEIGINAFTWCDKLTSISIPNSVTSIGITAFHQCHSLESVSLSNSMTTIEYSTFAFCTGLTSIIIPEGVTFIDQGAFAVCISLSSVTCLSETPPTLGSNVFTGLPANPTLYVPSGAKAAYQDADEQWNAFNIVELEGEVGIIFHTQPAAITNVMAGSISGSLTVAASVTDGASPSYQWYSATTASNIGGTEIQGATASSFTLPTMLTEGTYYYYCVVSATGATSVHSNVATVNVLAMPTSGTATINGTVTGAPAGTMVELYRSTSQVKSDIHAGSIAELYLTMQVRSEAIDGYEIMAVTNTNAAGDYLFDNMPEGIYIVVVVMEGYNSPPSDPVNITDDVISGTVNFTVDAATQTIEADIPFVVTGVENVFFPDLKIYPNPFTDRVRITGATTITTKGQAPLLRIINAAGVIVHTQEINSPDETILLEHLPAGVYFFVVEKNEVAKERKVKTVKVLKER